MRVTPETARADFRRKNPGATAGQALILERPFQGRVRAAALALGWKHYHTHRSQRSEAGYPDSTFARERIVFAELKRERGNPTTEQEDWLRAIAAAGGEAYLWRPSDWPEIVAALRRPPR